MDGNCHHVFDVNSVLWEQQQWLQKTSRREKEALHKEIQRLHILLQKERSHKDKVFSEIACELTLCKKQIRALEAKTRDSEFQMRSQLIQQTSELEHYKEALRDRDLEIQDLRKTVLQLGKKSELIEELAKSLPGYKQQIQSLPSHQQQQQTPHQQQQQQKKSSGHHQEQSFDPQKTPPPPPTQRKNNHQTSMMTEKQRSSLSKQIIASRQLLYHKYNNNNNKKGGSASATTASNDISISTERSGSSSSIVVATAAMTTNVSDRNNNPSSWHQI